MANLQLSEEDLEKLLITGRRKKSSLPRIIFKSTITIIVVFFLVFFILNYSALIDKFNFWYKDQTGEQITHIIQNAVQEAISNPQNASEALPDIADNSLYIESINAKLPITFEIINDPTEVSNNLKNGLIHLSGSSLPGEKGNSFITGHSSNYFWVKSQYNSAFALLDNVAVGDLIQIKYKNINYVYRISKKFVTVPNDSAVLDSYKETPTLTLMTCTPIGTNLKRLIVRADQIFPDPKNSRQENNTTIQELPAIVR